MKEARKLALEALETLHDENMDYLVRNKLGGENNQCMVFARDVIKSIKRTLAQPAQQEPVAYLCENAVGHKYFRWKKPSSTYKPIPLYTTPPQPEERNFCPRCGKRTADLTVIHTCTPPQENT